MNSKPCRLGYFREIGVWSKQVLQYSIIACGLLFQPLLQTLLQAADLGQVGRVYPISELRIDIYMQKYSNPNLIINLGSQIRTTVTNLKPAPGLRKADKSYTYNVDISQTLDEDMLDAKGKLLFPAGTKVNPFNHVHEMNTMIFVDGKDQAQMEFAMKRKNQGLIILTNGTPTKLNKKYKYEFDFDQFGALCKLFQIEELPAIVSKDGWQVKVEIIKLEGVKP